MTGSAPIGRLAILGATGDLARRMLLPSLYHLEADGLLPAGLRILGLARTPLDRDAFVAAARGYVTEALDDFDPAVFDRLAARLDYRAADVTEAADLAPLARWSEGAVTVYYFALSPALYGAACKALDAAGLACGDCRIVLEKPLGHDLDTARAINDEVAAAFDERRVFRVDHYLGKEAVQNLIALRFANTLFEPVWNGRAVDHVQILVAETDGVRDRLGYYDRFGALRDMAQNHMLQLLSLIAMEPPADDGPDSVRDEKVKVLKCLRPFAPQDSAGLSVRGQYAAGVVAGATAEGYAQEMGAASGTETFLALRADIDNWRWAGTPFFLFTGKRLAARQTRIVIQFKPLPHSIFGRSAGGDLIANRLTIDLQPDEDISLLLMNRRPGPAATRLQARALNLSLDDGGRRRIAYERLLADALADNPSLFVRRDEVELAWAWIDGVAASWSGPPLAYPAGSWGPTEADSLLGPGRRWRHG